jgi:hypothetical protein
MSKEKLDFEESIYDNVLYADGFEDAIIGIGIQGGTHKAVAVYNIEKMEQILMDRDGMDWGEAVEFLNFNTLGAYVGEHTPIYLETRDE